MKKVYYVYILLCSDNSFNTGMTNDLERRLLEHQSGKNKNAYTSSRLPLELKWYLECSDSRNAIQYEKKIKGWSRRKKQALIDENWDDLVKFSRNYSQNPDAKI